MSKRNNVYTQYQKDLIYFTWYKKVCNDYLKIFNSSIKGETMSRAAYKSYKKYKVVVPPELALSMCQLETSCGTNTTYKNNPFNIYEYDTGHLKSKKRFKSQKEGITAYYMIITRDYLLHQSVHKFVKTIKNKHGKRYASDKRYSLNLRKQIKYVKRWIYKRKSKSSK